MDPWVGWTREIQIDRLELKWLSDTTNYKTCKKSINKGKSRPAVKGNRLHQNLRRRYRISAVTSVFLVLDSLISRTLSKRSIVSSYAKLTNTLDLSISVEVARRSCLRSRWPVMRSIWGNRIMAENPDRRSAKRVLNQTGGYGKIWCGGVHVLYETLSFLLFPYNLRHFWRYFRRTKASLILDRFNAMSTSCASGDVAFSIGSTRDIFLSRKSLTSSVIIGTWSLSGALKC